jgi:hypothetical protein
MAGLALLAGCAQPGTQVPLSQAPKLSVGTSDISTACGYLEERGAFGEVSRNNLTSLEALAETGAQKLVAVYKTTQTDIYQGDSIGALLGDSISLLHDCGLTKAEKMLERALATHH